MLLKGQVSLQSASLAAVFKSWWQPAFTLAGAASYEFASGRPRYGLTVAVETFKNIRCERGGVGCVACRAVSLRCCAQYSQPTCLMTLPARPPSCLT